MLLAMIYPEADKGGRGKKGKAPEAGGFSRQRLGDARSVLAHSPALAKEVLADRVPLDQALKKMKEECRSEDGSGLTSGAQEATLKV